MHNIASDLALRAPLVGLEVATMPHHGSSRVAVGVKIGKRCDDVYGEQYVTSFSVSASQNGITWSYIGIDIQAVYDGIIATWWFDMDVSGRFWGIEPGTYVLHPSMQTDLLVTYEAHINKM